MYFFPDMSVNALLLPGLLAGLLSSVACGLIGPYVVTRRIVFLSGAIAHMALGGVGAAMFLQHRVGGWFGWVEPMHGAVAAAMGGAVVIALVHERVRERMDTLIGAMWAVGMSAGLLLVKMTPGYNQNLLGFLFGNIAIVGWADVWMLVVINGVILVTVVAAHKQFLAICIDPQQAALQGVNVAATNMLLLGLVALAVICLIQVVGLILVLALLTLPAATMGRWLGRMVPIMVGSVLLCAVLTSVPRVLVYDLESAWPWLKLAPESAIVLSSGAVYLGSVGLHRVWVGRRRRGERAG